MAPGAGFTSTSNSSSMAMGTSSEKQPWPSVTERDDARTWGLRLVQRPSAVTTMPA